MVERYEFHRKQWYGRKLIVFFFCLLFTSLSLHAQQGSYYRSYRMDGSRPVGYMTSGQYSNPGINGYNYGLYCDLFYEYETGKVAWIGFNPYTPWVPNRDVRVNSNRFVDLSYNFGGYSVVLNVKGMYGSGYLYSPTLNSYVTLVRGKEVPNTRNFNSISEWLSYYDYTSDYLAGSIYFGNEPNSEYSSQATMVLDQFGDGTAWLGGITSNVLHYSNNWIMPDCIKKIADNAFKTTFEQTTTTSSYSERLCLESINLDNIETIGNSAFYNCAQLRLGNFDDLTSYYGSNTGRTFDLRNTTTIGTNAFYNCKKIPAVIIHENVDPNGESNQFSNCTGMTLAEFTDNATRIPAYFFNACTALTEVKMDGITEFKDYCFNGCTSLHFDMLEMAGKTIGHSPFSGVTIDWMHIDNTTQIAAGNSIVSGMVNSNIYIQIPEMQDYTKYISNGFPSSDTIYVPRDIWQTYQDDTNWGPYKKQIKPIPGIGETEEFYVIVDGDKRYESDGVIYVISGNKSLTLVDLGSGNKTGMTLEVPEKFLYGGDYYYVKAIGNNSYTGVCQNTGFTNVVLASSITSLCDDAFKNSTSLTGINLDDVETIGTTAFSGCTSLSAVNLSSATSVGTSAFSDCTSLATATMGSILTSVPEKAFFNCSALDGIDLTHLQTIGISAFNGCSSLQSINLAAVVGQTNLGMCAFKDCTSLSTVSLNSTLRLLPDSIFKNCTSLETINLNTVWYIEAAAFMNCSSLTSINADIAARLGVQAFSGSGLKELTIPEQGFYSGYEQAFMNCLQLEKVVMESRYYFVDKEAFKGCTALKEVDLSYCGDGTFVRLEKEAFANCTSLESLDLEKINCFGDYCLDNCTSLVGELTINDDCSFGIEPFRGVSLSLAKSNLQDLYDYTTEQWGGTGYVENNAILSGVVNSTIYFTDKDNLYYVGEYLKKDETTDKYIIDENTYIYVHRDIWDSYQSAEGWEDVKDHILTWPPYDYYVYKDGHGDSYKYFDVEYELNDDGENTLTLTYVNTDIQYDVTTLEIPDTMKLTNKATGETTTFTVTRIGDKYKENSNDYGTGVFESFSFKKVILPPTLTKIGEYAFSNCNYLEEINLNGVKEYGDYSFNSCYNMKIHVDLRYATSIGEYAFSSSGLKSAWIGKTTGEYMFAYTDPMNIYIFEEDPTQVNASNVTYSLSDKSVVYVVCRNITSSEVNVNPLQLFHDHDSWGSEDVWKFVYPMLHQGNAIERQKTYTTFCFDKPLDFRGTNEEGNNYDDDYYGYTQWQDDLYEYYWSYIYNPDDPDEWECYYEPYLNSRTSDENLSLRGMLQFYLQPENNTSGFIANRIEALAVTGFQYIAERPGTVENGTIATKPAGIRPAGTGVLIHWHPGEEFHGATGLSEYYPIPPVRNSSGEILTESDFRELFEDYESNVPNAIIRTGTYENNTGLVNSGGRNLDRLEEGDEDGQYKDNYEGGTTTYNTTTGIYTGSEYDNLMIGNTVRIDSVFYKPWYYAYETDGEGHTVYQDGKPVLHKPSKDFDDNYKQFGLNPSCYFRRFYTPDEKESGSFMRAFRAYLRLPLAITGETENTTSGSPLLIEAEFVIGSSMDNDDQGGTTSVPNVNANENVNNGRYYTLDGRVLQGRPTQKGVYIMNGKKVVVK